MTSPFNRANSWCTFSHESTLRIDDLFKTLAQTTSQTERPQTFRLILALVDTDTTVVYYNLYNGIQPPIEEPLSRKHR
eukprot:Em0016g988a